MSYHEQLGVSRSAFDALSEHFQRREFRGREYRFLPDGRQSVPRGTALFDGVVVRGFPKISRTLVLDPGVPRHFDGAFAVEEKLNGYNVRIVRIDGETLAFTRGGLVCPFTTRKVESLLDLDAFFDDDPSAALCGEMIGPENPYTAHEYSGVDSLAFRAFDVRDRATGEPLPVRRRRRFCERHGVPQVPPLGVFEPESSAAKVAEIVRGLDAEGREGVIMKSLDGTRLLKYTTSAANRGDLAYAFSLPFDHGREFVFRRLVREAFQTVEWEETDADEEQRARELGESILAPMVDTIRRVRDSEVVGERHRVRGTPEEIDELLDHLRDQSLRIAVEDDRTADGERVVTFSKQMRATTDQTRAYLDGTVVRE
ncbi:RNA ligase [Halegenticoccus tardaugens]|uniref:RNA ligase n=1 Tax=Halegenticoccus tardaugens TaxID=2071624 RepID=UPI00100C25D4|nr:RNA ligase [Halegenticoccus tardaugens]